MGKNRIFFARWTPAIYWSLVSKPVSQDIQSICYCLHTGTFRLDTRDLLVAGVPISISSKYLYLYLALKVLTFKRNAINFLLPGQGVEAELIRTVLSGYDARAFPVLKNKPLDVIVSFQAIQLQSLVSMYNVHLDTDGPRFF